MTAKLETIEQLAEGIHVLAEAIDKMQQVQKVQGELLQRMDARIRALTGLIDHHHEVLTKLAGLPPRPKEDPIAVN